MLCTSDNTLACEIRGFAVTAKPGFYVNSGAVEVCASNTN